MAQKMKIMGNFFPECRYIPSDCGGELIFRNSSGDKYFGIDRDTLYRNILLMGAACSGKTTIIQSDIRPTSGSCQ